jgi:hypothetical protein
MIGSTRNHIVHLHYSIHDLYNKNERSFVFPSRLIYLSRKTVKIIYTKKTQESTSSSHTHPHTHPNLTPILTV